MLSGEVHDLILRCIKKVIDTLMCHMWLWCHTFKAMDNFVGFVEGGTTK